MEDAGAYMLLLPAFPIPYEVEGAVPGALLPTDEPAEGAERPKPPLPAPPNMENPPLLPPKTPELTNRLPLSAEKPGAAGADVDLPPGADPKGAPELDTKRRPI